MNIAAIALRNIGRNRRRSALSALAIAVATMVTVFMFALIEGLKVDMIQNIYHMVSGQVRVRTAAYDAEEKLNPLDRGVPDIGRVLALLEKRPEVRGLSPRITFPTALYRNGKTFKGMGIGMDFGREEGFQGFSRHLAEGSLPSRGERETVLSVGLARSMGVGTGDKITLFTKNATGGMNGMTLRITGLARFTIGTYNDRFFFAPLDTVQRLLGMVGSATEVLLILREGQDERRAAAALSDALLTQGWSGLSVKTWSDISVWYTYLSLADAIYGVFAGIFVLLGTTVMINTTMMVIYERVREIGTLGALGMAGNRIVLLFFLESAILAAIGSLAGALAGIAITLPFSVNGMDFSEAMKGVEMEMSFIYYPVLNMKSTGFAFLYAAAVSSAISIIPSRRASRIEPVKALRAV